MINELKLYILNADGSVSPFLSGETQLVLYDFSFDAQRMGAAPEIKATVKAEGSDEASFTLDVFCEYNGERYFLKNTPSSSKENTDARYTYELTFVSERTILDNVYMIDAVQGDSNIDRYQSNSTNVVFMGTIEELIGRLNAALKYAGVDYSVVLDTGITTDAKLVSFEDKFFTEALQESVNIYEVPYYYVGKVIHFGWAQTTLPTLKYGDGLLSINKDVQNDRIITRATATGSSENIPYYYPNPTPKGFITPIINAVAQITVNSDYKLSQLPEESRLRYYDFTTVNILTTEFTETVNQEPLNVVPKTSFLGQETTACVFKPEYSSYVMATLNVKSSKLEYCDIILDYHKDYADYRYDNKNFKTLGVYPYIRGQYNGQESWVLASGISASFVEWNGGQVTAPSSNVSHIKVENIPTNTDVCVAVVYLNTSNNAIDFRFNFTSELSAESGWYLVNEQGDRVENIINPQKYGVLVSGTPADGDEVYYSVSKKLPIATSLMPPIYRKTNGEERFYNALNGLYPDVVFANEYSERSRREFITKFEHIKPTIVGTTNKSGARIDMFKAFAYDLTDSDETEVTDENTESFIHPYFYAKLRKMDGAGGFNLFSQAIESGEMTVEMTNGICGACKFTIMVDSNTQRNLVLVDDNGDLIYDEYTGKVKMADDTIGLDRQNDTQNYEVWVALKKDINTYGQVMPNVAYSHKPSTSDTFVLTNILLPQSYIDVAEKKVEDAIIDLLVKHNTGQADFSVNLSRIYLKNNPQIYADITENSALPIEYNGNEYLFYISSYTYRKQANDILPEISVSLVSTFASTPSGLQQAISSIETRIAMKVLEGTVNIEELDQRYLRKDVPQNAKELITFEKGLRFAENLQSTNFKKGTLGGLGFGVYLDENGKIVLETDRMIVRDDAQFSELVINQMTYQLGATVFSRGGCQLIDVEEKTLADNTEVYRCYYDNKSGTRYSGLAINDIVKCQRYDNSNQTEIKYYKRLVVAVGDDYIDLSKTIKDGSDIPESGDEIVQYGNTTDTNRQYVIIRDVIGGGYDRMLSGLNSISATGNEYYFAGRLDGGTPRWFVGDKQNEYIEYADGKLKIVANITIGPDTDLSKNKSLQDALKTAGGNKVFYFPYNDDGKPSTEKPSNYKQGDLWIVQEGIAHPEGRWGAGDIVVAQSDITSVGYRYIDWVKKTKYTDDTAANKAKAEAAVAVQNAQDAQDTANGLKSAVETAQKDSKEALTISNRYNDDGYLTPSEKRTLRQMMYELSDSEGVSEPYWAELAHTTVVQTDSDGITTSSNPWYIVKNGDKSNGVLQDGWVGWWSSNVAGISNGRNRQIISIDMNNESPRGLKLSWASNAEGGTDFLKVVGFDGLEIGNTANNQSIRNKTFNLKDGDYPNKNITITYHKGANNSYNTDAGYYKIEGTDSEYWDGNYQYLCYKGSYPTLYAALYNAGKADEANELKTRFTAIIDCLQLAEVYGDENSKKNTSLEGVNADFRQNLHNALTEYYNFVEICNLNDVDYLKKVFPNAVLDSNGAVLSQLLAVKDGTGEDAKIVAGLYGGGSYDLNKNTKLYDPDIYEDEEQEILSHEGHGALMIFAGADGIENVKSAATRIYEDGTIYTNKLIAEGADISGKITSIEGEIGGFSIDTDSLTTVSSNLTSEVRSKMILNKTGIEFYRYPRTVDAYDKRLVIGTSIYSSGGYNGLLSIKNSESDTYSDNYGISVDVSGGKTNYAIYVPNGLFAGLRPNIRTLTSSDNGKALTNVDCVVVCNGVTSLYLPSPPQIGQMCIIKKITSANVTINGNGKSIFLEASANSITLNTYSALQLHYDGSRWIGGYLVKS